MIILIYENEQSQQKKKDLMFKVSLSLFNVNILQEINR